ncbi:MAG: glucosyltransferase domain-containing protein [Faecousia sp.]
MERLTETIEKHKQLLLFCLLSVFLWGLMAHGYGFLHSSFSHDSLYEFNGDGISNYIRVQNGRFVSPVCRKLFRTDLTLTWLIGVLGLIWISLSVFLTVRIFNLESKVVVFLISGFFTANLTVSSTAATFMHDFDCDMLALLFSITAVFLWRRKKWGFAPGAVFVMLSLGLYQSYICVTITMVMLVCMMDLLDGKRCMDVLRQGLRGCAMLLLGGVIYFVIMKAVLYVSQIPMLSDVYNSLDRPLKVVEKSWFDIRYLAKETYQIFFERVVDVLSPFPAVTRAGTLILLAITGGMLGIGLLSKRVHPAEKILLLVLTALLPLAMNLMHLITLGSASHELMIYAYWLVYLLPLLLGERLLRWIAQMAVGNETVHRAALRICRASQLVCMLAILVLSYANVQTANAMYLKKDLEQDAYLSVMTRVVYRMEEEEAYIPGETPVVIVGLPQQLNEVIPGFEPYRKPNGMWMSDVLNYGDAGHWAAYFKYVLLNPAKIVSGGDMYDDPRVQALPCYPAQGCVSMIDGTLYVKLG